MRMKIYMIKHTKTGMYSTGGTVPKWVMIGQAKIWRRLWHVKSSITTYRDEIVRRKLSQSSKDDSSDWDIIEFDVQDSSGINMGPYIK